MDIPVTIVKQSPIQSRTTDRTIAGMGALVHGPTGKVREVHQYNMDGTMKIVYQDPEYKKLKDNITI